LVIGLVWVVCRGACISHQDEYSQINPDLGVNRPPDPPVHTPLSRMEQRRDSQNSRRRSTKTEAEKKNDFLVLTIGYQYIPPPRMRTRANAHAHVQTHSGSTILYAWTEVGRGAFTKSRTEFTCCQDVTSQASEKRYPLRTAGMKRKNQDKEGNRPVFHGVSTDP
jgi:hypothetical protein